jgi:ligand-binding sensor domain-containing protein
MSALEKQRGRFAVRAGKLNLSQFLPLSFLLFFAVNSVCALDPHRRITQYGHTAWRVQDGLIDSSVAVTQTADGYIWIAARSGLFQYDGVTFSPWVPPNGQRMGSSTSLLGATDGSLWIGTTGGLYRWKNGELQTYTNEPGRSGITAIIQDHTGAIWVTRYRVPEREGPLCRVEGGSLHCYGKSDGIPVRYGLGLAEDNLGNLWMGSSALCRWRPGSTASTYFGDVIERLKAGNGAVDVAAGSSESVWATLDGVGPELGVRHYSEGKWESYVVPGFDGATVRSNTLFIDRNKSLWIGTENKGLYHIHDGVADHYGSADGMSGDSVGFIYEDHEGDLWVATDGGLDLFRDTAVVSFSTVEGLSAADIRSVVALRNGSVWLGNAGAVDILSAGKTSPLSVDHAFPGRDIGAMFEDHTGGMWLGLDENTSLMIYQQGESHEIKAPDGSALGSTGAILGIAEDVEHNIWVLTSGREHQLFRITDQKVREAIRVDKDYSFPAFLVADREDGIWMVSKGGIARLRDGRFQKSSLGHTESSFKALGSFVDSDNSLWVATTVGVFRWNNGRLNVIDASNGLPCITIFSAIKDNSGSLWLAARCGFLKIEAVELKKWNDRPDSHLAIKKFDAFDGAHPASASILQPAASKSPDGRLWFINGKQAQMIDPDRSYINNVPPPVHIEEIIANHKNYLPQEHLRLPALTRELQFNYTALSFSVPGKVRFREEQIMMNRKFTASEIESNTACSRNQPLRRAQIEIENCRIALVPSEKNPVTGDVKLRFRFGTGQMLVLPLTWKELVTHVRDELDFPVPVPENDVAQFSQVRVNFLSMEVQRSGCAVKLTSLEFKVLKFFVSNPNRVIKRDELLDQVWGYSSYPCTRTVGNLVLRLRQKLEPDLAQPVHFRTVYGSGYKFIP